MLLDLYFPYRNGLFLLYEGPLEDEEEIRRWLMDEDVLMIPGHVEEVNVPLLTYLYETDDDIVVFFYEARLNMLIVLSSCFREGLKGPRSFEVRIGVFPMI